VLIGVLMVALGLAFVIAGLIVAITLALRRLGGWLLALVALGHYTLRRKRGKLPLQPITFWLLVAFAFFFTLQMTLGASQHSRYVLPAFVILEVLAAVGLVGLAHSLEQVLAGRDPRLAHVLCPMHLITAGTTINSWGQPRRGQDS
jgi:hypothetical protein